MQILKMRHRSNHFIVSLAMPTAAGLEFRFGCSNIRKMHKKIRKISTKQWHAIAHVDAIANVCLPFQFIYYYSLCFPDQNASKISKKERRSKTRVHRGARHVPEAEFGVDCNKCDGREIC